MNRRWESVERILEAALEHTPEERSRFVRTQCGADEELRAEVEAYLNCSDESETFLVKPAWQALSLDEDMDDSPEIDPYPGRRVGVYRIVRRIASGGMGSVYLAERDDEHFEHRVAVKIIRHGFGSADILRRFKAERQLLARLDHTYIAKLLDGGATEEGVPYLVMEFIDGEPIDEYCAKRNLSVEARLKLFLAICSAVQYAHQNLVVHRDLKPQNILITNDGTPKLLDFGIARLLQSDDDETATSFRTMTLNYASPEQIRCDVVGTASDQYSLGVILFELLCGERPYRLDGLSPALAERSSETPPPKPSASVSDSFDDRYRKWLSRRLAGDLDNIVLMAMRPVAERRYPSVERFANDIRLHLSGMPVTARPDALSYRTRKFIRRNAVAVAAGLVVLLSLSAGLVSTSWQARIAQRERDAADIARVAEQSQREAAESNAHRAEQVSRFLGDLFEVAAPDQSLGETLTARQVLDRGTARIESELRNQPKTRAMLMTTMGGVYMNLGAYEEAGRLLQSALEIRREECGPSSEETAETLNSLADLAQQRGEYDKAEHAYTEALDIRRDLLGPDSPGVAETLNGLGLLLERKGEYERSEHMLREALAMREKFLTLNHFDTVETMLNLAGVCHRLNRLDESLELYSSALALERRLTIDLHPDLAVIMNSLAALLIDQERYDQAESFLNESLSMRRKLFGVEHPRVASSLSNLANLYKATDRLNQARSLYEQSLAMRRNTLPEHHPDIALSLNNLASLHYAQKRFGQAAFYYLDALKLWERQLGRTHPTVAVALINLANVRMGQGNPSGAAALYRRALAIRRESLPDDHPATAKTGYYLALALARAGNASHRDEASQLLTESIERFTGYYGTDHRLTTAARKLLANLQPETRP